MKIVLPMLALVLAATTQAAAQDDTWTWRKAIPAGQTVEIRGIMGRIVATAASGREVEIVARKSARSGDVSEVRVVAQEHADGVTICTVYGDHTDCDDDHHRGRGNNNRENDTRVDYEVRVPRGVKFTGRNVSGSVEANGLDARVKASTVSGSVRVSTSDIASASSVSGSIRARMGRADWSGTLGFSTVSGDIELEFGSDLNADVEMSTVSGDFRSDWPVALNSGGRRDIRGRIGSGGRELTFSTVSGSVELRRAQ